MAKSTKKTKDKSIPSRMEYLTMDELRKLSVLPDVFQHRENLREATIREYATKYRNGEEFPALMVAQIEDGLFLIDGFHRLEALKRLYGPEMLKVVSVEIVQCKDEKEARWIGAQRNMRHGVPLTRKDRRNVFNAYVDAGMHWKVYRKKYKSWRQIATDVGITHKTARDWMKQDHRKIWEKMSGEEGSDMHDKETMGERQPVTLAEAAMESIDQAYQTSLGITSNAERREVVKHVESIHRRLVQELYDVTPPGERRGLLRELETDF